MLLHAYESDDHALDVPRQIIRNEVFLESLRALALAERAHLVNLLAGQAKPERTDAQLLAVLKPTLIKVAAIDELIAFLRYVAESTQEKD